MIKNDRQLKITKAQADRFRESAESYRARLDVLSQRERIALQASSSVLATLERQIEEYEALRRGEMSGIRIGGLKDLPKALIQMRIALGWSQRELAEKLGLPRQQVQRWEQEDYENISFARLEEVAEVLGVSSKIEVRDRRLVQDNNRALSGDPVIGALRFKAPLSQDQFWSTAWNGTHHVAWGELRCAENDGAPRGRVALIHHRGSYSIGVEGMGDGIDGSYALTKRASPAIGRVNAEWDLIEEKKYA